MVLLGCNAGDVCVSGETQQCYCPNLDVGSQYCVMNQTGWSDCICLSGNQQSGQGGGGDIDDTGPGGEPDGAALYQTYCGGCHGGDASGVPGVGPDIREDVAEDSQSEIVEVILEGEDDMPAIPVSRDQAFAIAAWLKEAFGGFGGGDEDDD